MAYAATREQAHEFIDRMAPDQVTVAVGLLVKMLDPVTRTLANAPFDDEAISADEELEAAAAMAETGPATSMEELWVEYGVTLDELRKLTVEAHFNGI